jgi:hypothetical protein
MTNVIGKRVAERLRPRSRPNFTRAAVPMPSEATELQLIHCRRFAVIADARSATRAAAISQSQTAALSSTLTEDLGDVLALIHFRYELLQLRTQCVSC